MSYGEDEGLVRHRTDCAVDASCLGVTSFHDGDRGLHPPARSLEPHERPENGVLVSDAVQSERKVAQPVRGRDRSRPELENLGDLARGSSQSSRSSPEGGPGVLTREPASPNNAPVGRARGCVLRPRAHPRDRRVRRGSGFGGAGRPARSRSASRRRHLRRHAFTRRSKNESGGSLQEVEQRLIEHPGGRGVGQLQSDLLVLQLEHGFAQIDRFQVGVLSSASS